VNNHLKSRKSIIKGIFLISIVILTSKLFYIQIINAQYKRSAKNNAIRPEVQQAARGLIYDRNGKLMVSNKPSYDLMVIPRDVKKFDTLRLSSLTELSLNEIRIKLKNSKNYSEYKQSLFSKQLDVKSAHQIQEELNSFQGFFVRTNRSREYNVDVAAHVIGFLGEVDEKRSNEKYYTKGDLEGKTGIESSYERQLRGEKGMKMVLVDVLNRPQGSFDNGKHDTLAVHGKNITTTLDIKLQEYSEHLMQNKIGAIVAIEPNSGEILTLVSSPNYNPKKMTGRQRSKNYSFLYNDINKPLFNRALNGTYPPASPLKIVNSLIFLQEKSLNKNQYIACNKGFLYGNNKIMRCHEHSNLVNLESAIAVSCNTYFCNTWESFFDKYNSVYEGYDVWKEHVKSFGFGDYLNNDFISGKKGSIPEASYFDKYYRKGRWKSSTILSMSIGQGELLCTPIQMANLTATIANRGFYYIPHIIKKIENDTIPKKFTQKNYTSIQPKHFNNIIDGMEQVLENIEGTAFSSRINELSVCGKTGTAENPHGDDHSIFIAFAPKENPKIAIAVYIENASWGSTWAAPIATLIIEKYLNNTISRPELEKQMIDGNLIK
tara:strand:+ start:135 stop:1943 length:1809 start_codon:yes stop_codon:yes gene_type:complete